jgi:glyoxylase-like metal-dependent hydrolase (beta-lactamase superfamily II)
MKIYNYEPDINLIDLDPPIPGFEGLLSCYVVKSNKIALIDIGPTSSLPNLFSALAELRISPESIDYLLCSHIHLDHTGGIGDSINLFSRAKVIVHEKGIKHLVDPSYLWQGSQQILGILADDYGAPAPVSIDRLISAKDGMIVDLGGIHLEILLTPGHASHHISFYEKYTRRLFVGEAAGVNLINSGGLRPAAPTPFDLKQSLESIDKMIALNPETIYYAHFGKFENAVYQLNQSKQQLRLWGAVIASHLNDNCEWQEIFQEIVDSNHSLEKIFTLSEDHRNTLYSAIKSTIFGYRDYLQRAGTQVLESLNS